MIRPGKKTVFLLKTVFSAGLIILLLSGIDFPRVWKHISGIHPLPYLAALLLIIAGTAGSTLKWRLLLNNLGIHKPFLTLLRYYYMGSFYSMFLPTTVGGDVVRTALLGKESGQMVRTASSVLTERIFGLHALLGVASCSFLLSRNLYAGKVVEPILYAVAGAFLVLTLLLFIPGLIKIITIPARRIAMKTGWKKITSLTEDIESAVRDLWSLKKNLFRSAGISILFQLSLPLQAALISSAMHLNIPWQYFFAITPVSVLLTTIPVSLNGIGIREWVAVFLYGSLGVKKETILALSFMGFFLVVLNALIGGVVVLFRSTTDKN